MGKILVVDDKSDIRELIIDVLKDEGHSTIGVSNVAGAISAISSNEFDLIILDIWLEGSKMDGVGLLRSIRKDKPLIPVLMISGHANAEVAALAIKLGAYDFIEKPFKSEKLILLARRAIASKLMTENNLMMRQSMIEQKFIGISSDAVLIRREIKDTALTNARVLIEGESGTGKGLVAQLIGDYSCRLEHKFVRLKLHCLTYDEIKLAICGGVEKRGDISFQHDSVFRKADKGILFLENLTSMSMDLQAILLKIIQSKKLFGEEDGNDFDIKIIASISVNLEEAIANKSLNSTLASRIATDHIYIPPLSQRRIDIEPLIVYFCEQFSLEFSEKSGNNINMTQEVMAVLLSYSWPGNVLQLRNAIERLFILARNCKSSVIDIKYISPEIVNGIIEENKDLETQFNYINKNYREAKNIFEKEYLLAQLEKYSGNISRTANAIGIDRTAMHRKLKMLGVQFREDI